MAGTASVMSEIVFVGQLCAQAPGSVVTAIAVFHPVLAPQSYRHVRAGIRPLAGLYPIISGDVLVVKFKENHQVRNKAPAQESPGDTDRVTHLLGHRSRPCDGTCTRPAGNRNRTGSVLRRIM